MSKLQELLAEFRQVFSGRGSSVLDSLLPPLVFLLVLSLSSPDPAIVAALAVAALIGVLRLSQRRSFRSALAGFFFVLLAAVFVRVSGSGTAFYLPGLLSSALTILACFLSVLARRPLVAWTSHLTRRWPLGWYWHPRVRPAYSETTLAWGVAFSLRLALEYSLFQSGDLPQLGAARLLLGWPFTIALLVATYLYGLYRLRDLAGPSVEEYTAASPPPWEGQRRGF